MTDDILQQPITVPFCLVMTELLGNGEHVKITFEIAHLLSVIDTEEIYVHVEFPNAINNYTQPVLWRTDAWRAHYERYATLKQFCELERAVYHQEAIHIQKLLRQINHFIKPVLKEIAQSNELRARSAIKKRDLKMIKFFNVNVDDLIQADRNLAEFNRKLIAKKTGQKI